VKLILLGNRENIIDSMGAFNVLDCALRMNGVIYKNKLNKIKRRLKS
jgi:hypothetical protein